MPQIKQQHQLPFAAEQLYALVADIEKYPDFLPWCQQVRILRQYPQGCDARVIVGFKGVRQSYQCRVSCKAEESIIEVEYLSGPLADLYTRWQFIPILKENSKASCQVNFELRFQIRNRLLSMVMDKLMISAIEKMTQAFAQRAEVLYGSALL